MHVESQDCYLIDLNRHPIPDFEESFVGLADRVGLWVTICRAFVVLAVKGIVADASEPNVSTVTPKYQMLQRNYSAVYVL